MLNVWVKALKKEGFTLVSDGTDNHLILLDVRSTGLQEKSQNMY